MLVNLPYILLPLLAIWYTNRQYNKVIFVKYKYKFRAYRDQLERQAYFGEISSDSKAYKTMYNVITTVMNNVPTLSMYKFISIRRKQKNDVKATERKEEMTRTIHGHKVTKQINHNLNNDIALMLKERHIIIFNLFLLLRKKRQVVNAAKETEKRIYQMSFTQMPQQHKNNHFRHA